MRFQPQFWRSFTSLIRTSSTSPAFAPRTATGPVMMCPAPPCATLAWISWWSGRISKPSPLGRMSRPPETVFSVTVSPESISSTGSSVASKKAQ